MTAAHQDVEVQEWLEYHALTVAKANTVVQGSHIKRPEHTNLGIAPGLRACLNQLNMPLLILKVPSKETLMWKL